MEELVENKITCFRDLLVWQKANDLFLQIASNIERFPRTHTADLISRQLLGSA